MKTIGTYSVKQYKCNHCNFEFSTGTNHWGEIYSSCKKCGKIGATCLEPLPEGYEMPEKWKTVRLGEVVTIRIISPSEIKNRDRQ